MKMTQICKITNWSPSGVMIRISHLVHYVLSASGKKRFTGKLILGVGGKGNSGVAATIKNQPGSIGYLNYGYVNGGKFQHHTMEHDIRLY